MAEDLFPDDTEKLPREEKRIGNTNPNTDPWGAPRGPDGRGQPELPPDTPPPRGLEHDTSGYEERLRGMADANVSSARNLVNSNRYAGQDLLRESLAQGRRQNMQMAGGMGGDPSTARAAHYANAQMTSAGHQQGKTLALQEHMARQALLQDALQQRTGYEQMIQDDATRRYLGQLEYLSNQEEQHMQRRNADDQFESALIGGAIGGVGGVLGGMLRASDERGKDLVSTNDPQISPYGYMAPPGTNPYNVRVTGPGTVSYNAPDPISEQRKKAEADKKEAEAEARADARAASEVGKGIGDGLRTAGATISAGGAAIRPGGPSSTQIRDAHASNLSRQLEKTGTETMANLAAPPPDAGPAATGRPLAPVREFPEGPPGPVNTAPNATMYGFYGKPGSYVPPQTTIEAAQRGLGPQHYGYYAQTGYTPTGDPRWRPNEVDVMTESDKRVKEVEAENRTLKRVNRDLIESTAAVQRIGGSRQGFTGGEFVDQVRSRPGPRTLAELEYTEGGIKSLAPRDVLRGESAQKETWVGQAPTAFDRIITTREPTLVRRPYPGDFNMEEAHAAPYPPPPAPGAVHRSPSYDLPVMPSMVGLASSGSEEDMLLGSGPYRPGAGQFNMESQRSYVPGIATSMVESDKRSKELERENASLRQSLAMRDVVNWQPRDAPPPRPKTLAELEYAGGGIKSIRPEDALRGERVGGNAWVGRRMNAGDVAMGDLGLGPSASIRQYRHLRPEPKPLGDVDAQNIETARRVVPQQWRYKPEFQAERGLTGRVQTGPMAQNLEETPVGSQYVYEDESGVKKVDTGNLPLANLGMISTLQKQIDRLSQKPTGDAGQGFIDSDKRRKNVVGY